MLLGVPKLGTEASFVVNDLYNDKSILGCRYGSTRPHHDIPMFVQLLPRRPPAARRDGEQGLRPRRRPTGPRRPPRRQAQPRRPLRRAVSERVVLRRRLRGVGLRVGAPPPVLGRLRDPHGDHRDGQRHGRTGPRRRRRRAAPRRGLPLVVRSPHPTASGHARDHDRRRHDHGNPERRFDRAGPPRGVVRRDHRGALQGRSLRRLLRPRRPAASRVGDVVEHGRVELDGAAASQSCRCALGARLQRQGVEARRRRTGRRRLHPSPSSLRLACIGPRFARRALRPGLGRFSRPLRRGGQRARRRRRQPGGPRGPRNRGSRATASPCARAAAW